MHTVFALLCFVVVIHWLIFPYPSGLFHWHCGNLTIAPVPAKQPWWIWINTSCEFIMNDCITTTKQSTTKPCAYFLGYTVSHYLKGCWLVINLTLGTEQATCHYLNQRCLTLLTHVCIIPLVGNINFETNFEQYDEHDITIPKAIHNQLLVALSCNQKDVMLSFELNATCSFHLNKK